MLKIAPFIWPEPYLYVIVNVIFWIDLAHLLIIIKIETQDLSSKQKLTLISNQAINDATAKIIKFSVSVTLHWEQPWFSHSMLANP